MWHINFVVIEQQNKQFSDTRSVYRHLSCTHLIAEWSFTYQSCDRSLWLVIPDHLQCWLDHGGSVNNKCFTKSNKKLSKNISDETYCLRSLLHFGVISSTIFLIHLFQCSLFRTEIFECAKITRWSHKKFCNFAVIESNQIPLGIFMCIWTSNKRVKFHVKIPSCCLENGKQL